MTKQTNTQTAYRVERDGHAYIVTLIRIRNDVNGNPRYEASISSLDDIAKYGHAGAFMYRFTGHYFGEEKEAEFIVDFSLRK